MNEDIKAREERRKKIRELEASLFGSSTDDTFKIDLPELQNVNEYSTKFGTAERQSKMEPPPKKLDSLLTQKISNKMKIAKRIVKKSEDTTHLLSDDEDENEVTMRKFAGEKSFDLSPSVSGRRRSDIVPSPRTHRSSFQHSGNMENFPRSETDQLDGGPSWSINEDPRQSVLDNMKKRHGIFKSKPSKSFDAGISKPDQPIYSVNGHRDILDHAHVLPRGPPTKLNDPDYDKKYSEFMSTLSRVRTPPSLSDSGSLSSESDKDPLSIGIQGSRLKHLKPIERPTIKIDNSPKQARSQPVLKERKGSNTKMVNFDHLELPADRSSSDTFRDLPSVLDDMPTDVFDKIPRAVTAREEKRLEQYHRKLERDRALRKAKEENKKVTESVNDPSKVSLIAALFTTANPNRRNDDDDPENSDKMLETDFMFALFIQQQEEDRILTKEGSAGRRGVPPPRPDPNDPEVGHFCAPFCPGFCEANFCIFHARAIGTMTQEDED